MTEIRLCTFRVGASVCAVDVLRVREILRATSLSPVPGANHAGLLSLRGASVPVVDLRKRLDVPPTGPGQVVVMEVARTLVGLLVDRTLGVVRAPMAAVRPLPLGGGSLFAGSLARQDGVVLLLDVKALLAPEPPARSPVPRTSRRRGKAA